MRLIDIIKSNNVDALITKLEELQPTQDLYDEAQTGLRTIRVSGTRVRDVNLGHGKTKDVDFEQLQPQDIRQKLTDLLDAAKTGRIPFDPPELGISAFAVALHAIHPLADGNKRAIAQFCDELAQDLGVQIGFAGQDQFRSSIHHMPFMRPDEKKPIPGWISDERLNTMRDRGFEIVTDIVTNIGSWDRQPKPPAPDINDFDSFEQRADALADYHIRESVLDKIFSVARSVGAQIDTIDPPKPDTPPPPPL